MAALCLPSDHAFCNFRLSGGLRPIAEFATEFYAPAARAFELRFRGSPSKVRTSTIAYMLSCSHSLQRAMDVRAAFVFLYSISSCRLTTFGETAIGSLHRMQSTAR